MSRKLRMLYVSPTSPGPKAPWILGQGRLHADIDWDVVYLPQSGSVARFVAALFLPRRLGRYDCVITAEYYEAAGMNLRLLLTLSRTRHVIWGLNQSRKALVQKFVKPVADRLFRRADAIAVHSTSEIAMFCALHGLDEARFHFVHWGFDLPPITPTTFSAGQAPYVCLIGRNNRDLVTFAEGLAGTGMKGVVIADDVPPGVRELLDKHGVDVHLKADFNTCLDCIRNATASAVLLNDSSRGAGHITMVAAMFLGVPQIVTDTGVVKDYFTHEQHGISVPLGAPDAFRQAVLELRDDTSTRLRTSKNAQAFAMAHFTNDAVAARFLEIIAGQKFQRR